MSKEVLRGADDFEYRVRSAKDPTVLWHIVGMAILRAPGSAVQANYWNIAYEEKS